MSTSFDALTTEALALSPDQRFELAQRLWESVEGQVGDEAELFAEIDRRCAEIDSGTATTYSHEEVMRDARKALDE